MAATVHTGWRFVTGGACSVCGDTDGWDVDGRGNVYCDCQRCPDCGFFDAYGFVCSCEAVTDDADWDGVPSSDLLD